MPTSNGGNGKSGSNGNRLVIRCPHCNLPLSRQFLTDVHAAMSKHFGSQRSSRKPGPGRGHKKPRSGS